MCGHPRLPDGLRRREGMNPEPPMPAKSKAQQKAAGAALSAKRGETPKSALKGASREMVESMSERELHDLAATPRKDKPQRVDDTRSGKGR